MKHEKIINWIIFAVFIASIFLYNDLSAKNNDDIRYCQSISKYNYDTTEPRILNMLHQKQNDKCCGFDLIDNKITRNC